MSKCFVDVLSVFGNCLLRQGKAVEAEPDVARPLTWGRVSFGPDGVKTTKPCLALQSAKSCLNDARRVRSLVIFP